MEQMGLRHGAWGRNLVNPWFVLTLAIVAGHGLGVADVPCEGCSKEGGCYVIQVRPQRARLRKVMWGGWGYQVACAWGRLGCLMVRRRWQAPHDMSFAHWTLHRSAGLSRFWTPFRLRVRTLGAESSVNSGFPEALAPHVVAPTCSHYVYRPVRLCSSGLL